MMQPPPASFIALIAARMPSQTPTWLMRITSRYSCSEESSISFMRAMPALLIRMSSRPYCSTTASTTSAHWLCSETSRWW